ncbi:MAG: diaminopimelate epimerase [Formosimonas sp.]
MRLNFTKMHGAGNDFIVIDAITHDVSGFSTHDWQHLASRHFGIGADQILLVERATLPDVDFKYTIYNQDGSLVENCGNGARCFVKYVVERGLTDKHEIVVQIATGTMILKLNPDGSVTVNMGAPKFAPADLPAVLTDVPSQIIGDDTVYEVNQQWLSLVSMGNPHAVLVVADVDTAPVERDGPILENHAVFPRKANIGFMQIVTPQHIRLRVFERGAGETLACGTGTCAAVVAGIRRGLLTSPVRVSARGGELSVAWAGGSADVLMSGPAVTVFEGQIQLGGANA